VTPVTRNRSSNFREMRETVEIWIVPLDPPERELRRLHALLSAAERERAGEPPFPPRKRRYVARQGALREILGRRTGIAPAALPLVRSTLGKPMLAEHDGIFFSVSDSAGLALVAIAGREVGVDVEQVRRRLAATRAAPLGADAFFARWTRDEAVGKALGTGLLRPRGGDGAISCASLDVGSGFAAAVAVAADGVEVRLRPY
jgi:4'-phosphopantetheinyl transferase